MLTNLICMHTLEKTNVGIPNTYTVLSNHFFQQNKLTITFNLSNLIDHIHHQNELHAFRLKLNNCAYWLNCG